MLVSRFYNISLNIFTCKNKNTAQLRQVSDRMEWKENKKEKNFVLTFTQSFVIVASPMTMGFFYFILLLCYRQTIVNAFNSKTRIIDNETSGLLRRNKKIKLDRLPVYSWYTPVVIMTMRASSLAYVNMSCTRVAHLTSQQLTNVNITGESKNKKARIQTRVSIFDRYFHRCNCVVPSV